jgi:hypothetical protein
VRQLSYLVVEALGADDELLLPILLLLALLRRPLLGCLGRLLVAIFGAHVAEFVVVGASSALCARLLEENILVGLDLNLLVLEGRQDAGASSGERLLLVLEDALRRRTLRL